MAKSAAPTSPSAAEVCQHFELGEEAARLLQQRQTSREFIALLRENKLYADALRFVAHALPIQPAIWWGSLCIWEAHRPEPDPKVAASLQAVVAWIQMPSETTRRAAEAAAKEVGSAHPAGMLGLAVFFSGGSISKPGLPAVEPKPGLAAKTLAGAVLLASKQTKPKLVAQRQHQFLVFAEDVSTGRSMWK